MNIDVKWYALIFVAITIEGITSYIAELANNKQICWQMVLTIILGIISAVAFDVDIFISCGVSSKIPYFGNILSGILLSRGSNYVYELIGTITNTKTNGVK